MTVCRYYLQGRCRYGDRCWNEHTDPPPSSQRRDYSWVAPSVDSSRSYSPPQFSRSNFSGHYKEPPSRYDYEHDSRSSTPTRNQYDDRYRWSSTPNRHYDHQNYQSYEGSNAPKKTTTFQLKSSNRFEALVQADDAGKSGKDSNLIALIKGEIISWENSHMWPFSCCSDFRDSGACLSGFVDISPEELRYTAYEAEKNGAFPFYTATVADALNEVGKKWNVLKNPTPEVLLSIESYRGTPDFCEENLRKLIPESTTGSFSGEQQINSGIFSQEHAETVSSGAFSFKLAHLNSAESLASSASAFKSVLPASNKVGNSTFGASPSVFGTSSSVFGSFSSSPVSASSVPSSVSSGFGSSNKERRDASTKTAGGSELKSCAYTQLENLTDNEKAQFSSHTFTLGKIPSRPPPVELCF